MFRCGQRRTGTAARPPSDCRGGGPRRIGRPDRSPHRPDRAVWPTGAHGVSLRGCRASRSVFPGLTDPGELLADQGSPLRVGEISQFCPPVGGRRAGRPRRATRPYRTVPSAPVPPPRPGSRAGTAPSSPWPAWPSILDGAGPVATRNAGCPRTRVVRQPSPQTFCHLPAQSFPVRHGRLVPVASMRHATEQAHDALCATSTERTISLTFSQFHCE